MVEIIGLVTISALVWLLAWSMAGESDAERRRFISGSEHHHSHSGAESAMKEPVRRAA